MVMKMNQTKWTVLVASGVLGYLMTAQVTFTSIILVDLFREYPHHKPFLGWLSGLNISLGVTSGVLISQIISMIPRNKVGAIASVVLLISTIVASFSPNLIVLMITQGIIAGFCNGFLFLIPLVTLQQYFPKRLNLAQGFFFSAFSLSFLTYAPFTRLLVEHFAWRGALLLHAGISFHSLPCFLYMRELKVSKESKKPDEEENLPKNKPSGLKDKNPKRQLGIEMFEEPLMSKPKEKESIKFSDTEIQIGCPSPAYAMPQTIIQDENHISNGQKMSNSQECIPEKHTKSEIPTDLQMSDPKEIVTKWQNGTDVPIPEIANYNTDQATPQEDRKKGLCEMFREKPLIILYLIGLPFVQAGNIIPFTLTPLQASQLGASDLQGALLISVAAAVSLVMRTTCGYIGDQRWSHALLMSSMGAVFGGILTAFIPLTRSYVQLAVLITIVSVPSATFMSTWSVNPGILVGPRFLVIGNGICLSAFGLGNILAFIGTGLFMDAGNPHFIYITFGTTECIGGLIILVIFICTRRTTQTTEPLAERIVNVDEKPTAK